MSDTCEKIELPSGLSVWYDDPTHAYYKHNAKTGKRGRRATGVTTVVKPLDHDPSNLLKWSARTQCIGVADYLSERFAADPDCLDSVLDVLNDPDAAWRELEARGLTYNDVRDRAATRGTNVHKHAFEVLARGGSFPDIGELETDEELGMAKAVQAFFFEHSAKFDLVEQIVYSERLGVAGRLDGLGEVDGQRVVLDVKTGNFISAAAHAQVGGGYPLLAKESGFVAEDVPGLILQVREDGSYDLIPAEATPTDFEIAVMTYRAASRINGAAMKAKKARREAVAA